jgi:hypothetical protein
MNGNLLIWKVRRPGMNLVTPPREAEKKWLSAKRIAIEMNEKNEGY